MADTKQNNEAAPAVELLLMPGSQFVMKAMAAMDHLGLEYKRVRVNPAKLKTELPPPHTVPVMRYNGEVVPDSHDILVYVNERHGRPRGRDLYAEARATASFASVDELEAWSGDRLYVWSLFYSWVDEEAWKRSLRPRLGKLIPGFLQTVIPCKFAPDKYFRPTRDRIAARCDKVLGDALNSDEAALAGLVADLQRLEAQLETDEQRYLMGTEGPTAADFAVYGNILRLADTSFDAKIGAGLPQMFDEAKTARLVAWFGRMKEAFPLRHFEPRS